ncbi:MAG: D-2-hydroxyacid dehydrogenase [Woeseiaceae bacterium]
MNKMGKLLATVAVAIVFAAAANAQSDLENLIEQTGIEAGPVAMRDVPGWKAPKKILVYGAFDIDEELQGIAPGIEFIPARSEADAMAAAADVDAIIGRCSNDLVNAAARATWVQVTSAGVERCMATTRIMNGQVILSNMQKMSSPVIAEHVTAMTLALARSLPQFINAMETGAWLKRQGNVTQSMQSVGGKTMLVVGLGGIGTEVARRAAALDMRVVGTRRSSREGPDFVDYVGLSDELLDLAAEADFIVNALPLTAETTGIFDAEFFRVAKTGAHFINVGRGKSVVTDDLVAALRSGQIAGAALDVSEPEPLPADHPLWQMHNVIITPHVAGNGGNRIRHMIVLRENLRRFAAGEALLNVVDPELGY